MYNNINLYIKCTSCESKKGLNLLHEKYKNVSFLSTKFEIKQVTNSIKPSNVGGFWLI